MLDFTPMTLERLQEVNRILYRLPDPGCEFSPVNMLLWGRTRVAVTEDSVYSMYNIHGADSYFLPATVGDLPTAVKVLAEDARERGLPLSLFGVTARTYALLEEAFPLTFCFYEIRSAADYVYDIHRLAELKGKKLQAKRNHIHRFEDACPDWQAVEITGENLPRVRAMVQEWYARHLAAHPEADIKAEEQAIAYAFDHREALGMEGLFLESEGRIVAMTLGNRIRETVFDVNFEKAFSDVPGAYAMMNRTFAGYLRDKYPMLTHLNREDDMGIEGLRKAKQSYYPDILLRKYVAVTSPAQVLR